MTRDLQVFLLCVASILAIETVGDRDFLLTEPWAQWFHLLWWVATCVIAFAALPCAWMQWRGEDWRPLWQAPRPSAHLWLYPAMYLFMLPFLIPMAGDPRFQAMYPFFKYSREFPWLGLGWEVAYGFVFVSVEFFFRGFLIHHWRPRWGA